MFSGKKGISSDERSQINKQVRADLIDHLYRGCLPGTVSGAVASIALFLDFYEYTPTYLILLWYLAFNFMMLLLSILYFSYVYHKKIFTLTTWEYAYSIVMMGCAVSWVPVIYIMPQDMVRQYLALIAIFLATTGYATGTIGQFRLCVATLMIILCPLIIWCFYKGGIFYNIIGIYSIIYMAFMFGANRRSTQWFRDSLKLKLENTLVSYQANHDLMTGLPNQRLLPQYLESAINIVKNTNNVFALVSFSLNRMDLIYDSLGQAAGNAIIQSVASRLNALAAHLSNENDTTQYVITISRKDIFKIILFPLTLDEATLKAKIIFSVLDEPFYLEKRGVKVTASMGLSIYGSDGDSVETLVTHADAAMLQAKQIGGNALEVYRQEISEHSPKKLDIENDLHNVLKNNQLQVYYQPLIDLKSGNIAGMEALLRWLHPVHGFISPIQFIPIAEETGLIIPIGEWVMRQACIQTRKWHQMGFASLKVAVNLAGKQIRHENIINVIEDILKSTGLGRQFLELEITETSILDESVTNVIKEFKNMGLSLSVDDFGTGYSGLSYLKRFSIDKLKIDQSFIRDIPTNTNSMTIVSAILAMGKELNVKTLAEGVETEEQLHFLRKKGCDYIQGYYFSKPIEASAFTQLLLNWSKRSYQSAVTNMEKI